MEWNKENRCIKWDIKQFFHKEDKTVVEWYFRFEDINNEIVEFDGMTLIKWSAENRILFLKEFKCDL